MQYPDDSQCPSTEHSPVPRDAAAPAAPPPVIDLTTQSGQIDSLVEAVAAEAYVTSTQLRDYYAIHVALSSLAHRSQDLVDRILDPGSSAEAQLELHLV